MAVGALLLGSLPDWLDLDFARTAAGVLAIVLIVAGLVVLFLVRSVWFRVFAVVAVGAAVVGLIHYRQELDHCDKNACSCQLFGEDLKGGGCTPAP